MQRYIEHMADKLSDLSPARLAEINAFIDFVRQRDKDSQLRQDFAQASESSFNKVWKNDDDAIYGKY